MNFLLFLLPLLLCSCTDALSEHNGPGLDDSLASVPPAVVPASQDVPMDVQLAASDAYNALERHFASNGYPDYFGGSFITPQGRLVVFIKGDSLLGRKKVSEIISTDIVDFRRAEFSFYELDNAAKSMDAKLTRPENKRLLANICWYGVMAMQNRLVVGLLDTSAVKIKSFRDEVCNFKGIVFHLGTRGREESYTQSPGKLVEINADTSLWIHHNLYSIGFRAREIGGLHRVGIVSAAHGNVIGQNVYYDTTLFSNSAYGVVISRAYTDAADAAFSFVTNTSLTPLSNTIYGMGTTLSVHTSEPGVGTIINKVGYKTGHTSGTIVCTNFRKVTSDGGHVLVNLTKADYDSDSGDSGGIVYTFVSSSNTRFTVGLHHGTFYDSSEHFTYRCFSKASMALDSLNLERY